MNRYTKYQSRITTGQPRGINVNY